MNKKVFVFDMDGVLVPSEKEWLNLESEERFLEKLLGQKVFSQMGEMIGVSLGDIYQRAAALGTSASKAEFHNQFEIAAAKVYRRCDVTAGVDGLVDYLKNNHWKLALVSSSPMSWVNLVLARLPWKDQLDLVLSVNEHRKIKPKPSPDGYKHILKTLGAAAKDSIALEDSNPGIASAKAAGLLTIGYTEHLIEGYRQQGADMIAKDMSEVLRIVVDAEKH